MDGGGESVNLTRFDSCRSISVSVSLHSLPSPIFPVCLCVCVCMRVLKTMVGICVQHVFFLRVPYWFHRYSTGFVFLTVANVKSLQIERYLNHEDLISSNHISS